MVPYGKKRPGGRPKGTSVRIAGQLEPLDRERFDRAISDRNLTQAEALRRALAGWTADILEPPTLMLEPWERVRSRYRVPVEGKVPFVDAMRFRLAVDRAGLMSDYAGVEAAILRWLLLCEGGLE